MASSIYKRSCLIENFFPVKMIPISIFGYKLCRISEWIGIYSKSYHVRDSILARVTVVQYWRTKIREISLNTEALTSAFPTLVLPGLVYFHFYEPVWSNLILVMYWFKSIVVRFGNSVQVWVLVGYYRSNLFSFYESQLVRAEFDQFLFWKDGFLGKIDGFCKFFISKFKMSALLLERERLVRVILAFSP